jgi:hypothetical protein
MRLNKYFIFLIFMGTALILLVPSCGKKTLPIPPVKDGNFLAVPKDLAFTLEKGQLTLTWAHTIDPVNAKLSPEAFEVFMAVKDAEACEGCPFVFDSVGMIPMPDMVYQQSLEPGFHYYFRVRAIGKEEMRSDHSKTIYVDFLK